MSAPQPADSYTYGDCTYGMALLYPDIAPDMGNAKDWIASARKKGYPVVTYPIADSIVSYSGGHNYSTFGHVAQVERVNPDGTFLVREMNYSGWNTWDERTSSMVDVQGFVIPPGSIVSGSTLLAASNQTGCSTFQFQMLGSNICMDAIIGVLAMGAGIALLVAGAILMVVAAQKSTAGKAATESASALRGAFPESRPAQEREGQPKPPTSAQLAAQRRSEATDAHRAAMRRAQLRTSRARARAAERRAIALRGGSPASSRGGAATARAKLKRGADPRTFTPAESKWMTAHPEEVSKLLKERGI